MNIAVLPLLLISIGCLNVDIQTVSAAKTAKTTTKNPNICAKGAVITFPAYISRKLNVASSDPSCRKVTSKFGLSLLCISGPKYKCLDPITTTSVTTTSHVTTVSSPTSNGTTVSPPSNGTTVTTPAACAITTPDNSTTTTPANSTTTPPGPCTGRFNDYPPYGCFKPLPVQGTFADAVSQCNKGFGGQPMQTTPALASKDTLLNLTSTLTQATNGILNFWIGVKGSGTDFVWSNGSSATDTYVKMSGDNVVEDNSAMCVYVYNDTWVKDTCDVYNGIVCEPKPVAGV